MGRVDHHRAACGPRPRRQLAPEYNHPDSVPSTRGKPTDKRDIWAFGCMLHEMLTGTRAFEDEDVDDTLAPVLPGALGEIGVSRPGTATVFDFRELNSEVASRRNPDDSGVCHRHASGISGFEFVVGAGARVTCRRTVTITRSVP